MKYLISIEDLERDSWCVQLVAASQINGRIDARLPQGKRAIVGSTRDDGDRDDSIWFCVNPCGFGSILGVVLF